LEPEKPLVFKATVPVRPTVKLGDWKAVKVQPDDFTVSQEELDQALENVRNQHGQWVPVEDRPVHVGDQVTLDVLTDLDGKRLGETAREVLAELDNEQPVPSWANHLAGLKPGDQKAIDDQIPDDYRDPSIAGKIATYHVTVKSIKQRELPEVDEELAHSAGDYDTLDALKADLRKRLETQKRAQAKDKFETEVVGKLVEASTVEYPAVMVEQELDQMMREMDSSFRRQGFTLEMFLRSTNQSLEDVRQEWQPRAERRIEQSLVLQQFIADEKLELDAGKLDAELTRIVEDTPADQRDEARRLVATERVRESVAQELLLRQALDVLDRSAGGDQFVNLEEVR
ncbi:MAG: trigger factor, partial [Chloroflexi bacterium]|nr:trigger factor [Chloroflexota bacterium]